MPMGSETVAESGRAAVGYPLLFQPGYFLSLTAFTTQQNGLTKQK
jgi:hypothetical protein